jgi:hypothetical protein
MIADLPNRDAEDLFPKLAFLEAAIVTHKGAFIAIRHALITLGVGEFKDFSKDPFYIGSLYTRPVNRAMLEKLYSYRSMIAHYRERGYPVKLIALYDRDEQRIVDRLFREMLTELPAQVAQVAAALTEKCVITADALQEPASTEVEAITEVVG